jgi:hypothetical protein
MLHHHWFISIRFDKSRIERNIANVATCDAEFGKASGTNPSVGVLAGNTCRQISVRCFASGKGN